MHHGNNRMMNSSGSMRAMPTNKAEFRNCAPLEQQFVQVPVIEHVLVERPVVYRKYEKKVTYSQVPIAQTYKKYQMPSQQQSPCQGPVQNAVQNACASNAGSVPNTCTSSAYTPGPVQPRAVSSCNMNY